ncbi:MAG: AAA family ATPase [Cyanobacteria bacterium P01_G01_bin.4]
MVPLQISLSNFLSYSHAVLDFSQLHTACICGHNGAGKSAILEGLTWGIWGQSRVGADDLVIRQGTTEAAVDITYRSFGQTYRILRRRSLAGHGSLEWQIQTDRGWRSLTQKGMRATQQAIQAQLRLDYNTFVNSAYLRQGRADEFTVKRPGERKRLLAEMLQLEQYDRLAEQCRERMRAAKVDIEFFRQRYRQHQEQLEQQYSTQSTHDRLQAKQQELSQQQARDRDLLEDIVARDRQREQAHQQVQWLQDKHETLRASLHQTETQWREQQQQRQELQELLSQAAAIEHGDRKYDEIAHQVESAQQQFLARQALLQSQQELQTQIAQLEHRRSLSLQKYQTQLDHLQTSAASDRELVEDGERIAGALSTYRQAQSTLTRLDRVQNQAAPLLKQLDTYQRQIDRERDRLLARQDSLQKQVEQLQQSTHHQFVEQAVMEVEGELHELTKQRVYRERVQEKCQERRAFVEQLQERQRAIQRQWQSLEDSCHQLLEPGQSCPLCTQGLEENLRSTVLEKQRTQQDTLSEQLWVIREQLAVTDREIELLQQEHTQLSEQLSVLDEHFKIQGRLQQQLESNHYQAQQLRAWTEELQELDRSLSEETFALSTRERLTAIESDLTQLDYNDKDHALCRSEVERWRWAAFKHRELRKAKQRLATTNSSIQTLEARLELLSASTTPENQELAQLHQRMQHLEDQLSACNYDEAAHQRLQQQLKQLQPWRVKAEALMTVRERLAQCDAICRDLKQQLRQHRQAFTDCQHQLDAALKSLAALDQQTTDPPVDSQITAEELKTAIADRRIALDRILSQLGATQQTLTQYKTLEQDHADTKQSLQQARRQLQVYRELAVAYGPNGIPVLIVENALPELEAEANQLLSRLTNNQLHLQFVTQRSGKTKKIIDTLDILIADPRGTRPYETYSGGEAFRINFAIRLALSRLLAQRSGASLQTLLIDEGFGTQDQAGRDSLVAAINAVASDFACILTITHIPSLRDRFPSRIQVHRTEHGSELEVLH